MKRFLKKLLEWILKKFSQRILKKFNPEIIAVTGSVGKTTTRDAIYAVISKKFKTLKNEGNYNTEIGIPLTLFGLKGGKSLFAWPVNLCCIILKSIFQRSYFEKVILEMGADHPGDIKYLTSFIKPKISIITNIGPAHLEFFKTIGGVVKEKGRLVEALGNDGYALLNWDDELVKGMSSRTRAHVFYYGTSPEADLWASDIRTDSSGVSFKAHWQGNVVPFRLNIFGRHNIYAALAAILVGIIFDMTLVEISQRLLEFRPPKGRLNIISGKDGILIIDDSYNANPASVSAALDSLKELSEIEGNKRTVAFLGDMLELGDFTKEGHLEVGAVAAKKVDRLVAVGEKSRFIAEGAERAGMARANIIWADSVEKILPEVSKIVSAGDAVLVKGSRRMRMERIVEKLKSWVKSDFQD